MTGDFYSGRGEAHHWTWKHDAVFRCGMVGTFNLRLSESIRTYAPARRQWRPGEGWYWYWLVRLDDTHYGWAYKWQGSTLPDTVVEVLSKRRLPDALKRADVPVNVYEPWDNARRLAWAEKQHTHQTFDWWPSTRVDSERKWLVLSGSARLEDADVLDIGTHYGFMSFRAAAAGANVVGVEPGDMERGSARTINDHIECQDVPFLEADPGGLFDVILYLSVHHQRDPRYETLAKTVAAYAKRARQAVYVEVILPPLFGKGLSAEAVDAMVDGTPLDTYTHAIRGTRRIYRVEGRA